MLDKEQIFIDQFVEKLSNASLSYIRSNIHENGWEKSNAHFKMCEILCEYITQRPYEKRDGTLRLKIHEITSDITDRLELSIGMPVPQGYVRPDIPDYKLPFYAAKLSLKLIEFMKKQDKEELKKLIWSE